MDGLDERLSRQLKTAIPVQYPYIDARSIVKRAPTSHANRGKYAIGGTVLAMLALAFVPIVLSGSGATHHVSSAAGQSPTRVTPQPSDLSQLTNGKWTFVVANADGRDYRSDTPVAFTWQGAGAVMGSCALSTVRYGPNHSIHFLTPFVTATSVRCADGSLPANVQNLVFRQILTGVATWQVASGRLTVRSAGGSVSFSAGPK